MPLEISFKLKFNNVEIYLFLIISTYLSRDIFTLYENPTYIKKIIDINKITVILS